MKNTCRRFNQLRQNKRNLFRLQFVLFGFKNNILSGTKYRVSPAGVSLMDETNNIASHLERLPLKSKSFMQYAGYGLAFVFVL